MKEVRTVYIFWEEFFTDTADKVLGMNEIAEKGTFSERWQLQALILRRYQH